MGLEGSSLGSNLERDPQASGDIQDGRARSLMALACGPPVMLPVAHGILPLECKDARVTPNGFIGLGDSPILLGNQAGWRPW